MMELNQQTMIVQLGDRNVRAIMRGRGANEDETIPAMQLIAMQARLAADDRIVISPCGNGALGVWAGAHTDPLQVALCDTHLTAIEATRQTLAANGMSLARAEVAVPSTAMGFFDVACLLLPKGRDLARLHLLALATVLRPGGKLYLAGPNKGGIKSVIDDAALLYGEGQVLAYKGGNRVALFLRPETLAPLPAPFAAPELAAGAYGSFEVEVKGKAYQIATRPGVFARHGLDAGTQLLLDVLTVRPTDRVVDVGCGYGIIGMVAAQRVTAAAVTLVDADLLAVECARETLQRNHLQEARVLLGDGLRALSGERFTLVVSNPPFHSGYGVTLDIAHEFVMQAHYALETRGRLVVVANRFLPYHRAMQACFGSVEVLAQTPKYRVLSAIKMTKRPRRRD